VLWRPAPDQAALGQQRRVDPASQIVQVLHRLRRVSAELGEQLALGLLVDAYQRLGQGQLDCHRHELLLHAVVDVSFDPAAFLVLGRHKPLPGRPDFLGALQQLLGQPEVAQHQADMSSQVADHPVLLRRQPLTGSLA
jgi:hypothetical protein